jgi:hypothetical protein
MMMMMMIMIMMMIMMMLVLLPEHRLCAAMLILRLFYSCYQLIRGRVLVYHPHTRRTHVVASGFFYSDGLAVSADGSYLLVVETDALRVTKVWLSGEKVRFVGVFMLV